MLQSHRKYILGSALMRMDFMLASYFRPQEIPSNLKALTLYTGHLESVRGGKGCFPKNRIISTVLIVLSSRLCCLHQDTTHSTFC